MTRNDTDTTVRPDYALDVTLVDGEDTSAYATSTDDGCGSGNTGSNACSGGK